VRKHGPGCVADRVVRSGAARSLAAPSLRLLLVYLSVCNADDGETTASSATIAELSGLTARSSRHRAHAELLAHGLVEVAEQGGGRGRETRYRLVVTGKAPQAQDGSAATPAESAPDQERNASKRPAGGADSAEKRPTAGTKAPHGWGASDLKEDRASTEPEPEPPSPPAASPAADPSTWPRLGEACEGALGDDGPRVGESEHDGLRVVAGPDPPDGHVVQVCEAAGWLPFEASAALRNDARRLLRAAELDYAIDLARQFGRAPGGEGKRRPLAYAAAVAEQQAQNAPDSPSPKPRDHARHRPRTAAERGEFAEPDRRARRIA